MRLIAYTRVSTDSQAERGMGLDVQRDAIRDWAKAYGHKVVAWHCDAGVSGTASLDQRPGLSAAFAELAGGAGDGLVVYRLDRLARKLALQLAWIEQLEERGNQVISVTEPDVGNDEMRELVRNIMGAIAQWERATIKRRMQTGRAAKHQAGGYAYGSPAYGWTSDDGVLVPVADQQAVISRITGMSQAGQSTRHIAAALNSDGIPSKRGGQWHPETVRAVLAKAAQGS